jgi:hypothetical protein
MFLTCLTIPSLGAGTGRMARHTARLAVDVHSFVFLSQWRSQQWGQQQQQQQHNIKALPVTMKEEDDLSNLLFVVLVSSFGEYQSRRTQDGQAS